MVKGGENALALVESPSLAMFKKCVDVAPGDVF